MMTMPDELSKLAAAAVNTSPHLQQRINNLVSELLDEAEEIMESGTPKAKADLINRMIPHVVRQMNDKAEDESLVQLRKDMQALREVMRPLIGTGNVLPIIDLPSDGATEDTPRDIESILRIAAPRQATPHASSRGNRGNQT